MRNIELAIKHYSIILDEDNPNLLIYGKTGSGKSFLLNELIEGIKHDFIFIGNKTLNKDFIMLLCGNGLDIRSYQGAIKDSSKYIGNLVNLEIKLNEEIGKRESIGSKEKLTPMLVVIDELDSLLERRYKKKSACLEYKSRMNYYIEKGSKVGIYFILTSQSRDISPINESLFRTQIETNKVDSGFLANCLICQC